MIREYPDYYRTFACIGGKCPDSCCIGWEVDIDEETFYYYRTVRGSFGRRLNAHMEDDGEDKFFPLTEKNRCPFLNERNLCDIILNLGEESLCQVCTEYPRYYLSAGNYEQIDMSLSCMELGRIFFSDPLPIRYVKEEIPGDTERPDPAEEGKLEGILQTRNRALAVLEDRNRPFSERTCQIFGQDPLSGKFDENLPAAERETDTALLHLMSRLEVLDERWIRELEEVSRMAWGTGTGSSERQMEIWFEKLASYFTFRYALDAFPDGRPEEERRFIRRSLRFLFCMCRARMQRNHEKFGLEDMIDTAHLYSKEVEHSLENVEFLKTAGR